jgi:hypothetical protein
MRDWPKAKWQTMACINYIVGVLDTLRTLRLLCDPNGANESRQNQYIIGDMVISMAIKYLNDHPNARNLQAASVLGKMYIEAFPCPN